MKCAFCRSEPDEQQDARSRQWGAAAGPRPLKLWAVVIGLRAQLDADAGGARVILQVTAALPLIPARGPGGVVGPRRLAGAVVRRRLHGV